MPDIGRFARNVRLQFWKPPVKVEVSEEFAHHVEMLERDYVAQGMSPEAARTAAAQKFGRFESIEAECLDLGTARDDIRRRTEWWSELAQDTRQALRQLRNSAHFAAVAIGTLAIGLGAATIIFAIANAVLLRPLPFHESNRLVLAFEKNPAGQNSPISQSNFLDWQARLTSFSSLAIFEDRDMALVLNNESELLRGVVSTHTLFHTLGAQPALGRTFLPEEDRRGGDTRVAILSYALWRQRFGGAADVVGRSIDLNGVQRRVVGIMGEGFNFPDRTDVWIPLAPVPDYPRDDHRTQGIGRLKAGVSLDQANQELVKVSQQLSQQYMENAGWSAALRPFKEWYVSPQLGARMKVLLATVVLLLGMAWVNVANLLLARATTRDREMAVRVALGAGRWRMLRQLFTESFVLSVAGAVAGLIIAALLVPLIRNVGSSAIPRLEGLSINWQVLAFLGPICILTAISFCGATAARLTLNGRKGTSDRLHDLLRSGSRVAESGRGRQVLIVASVSLAMMLLVSAGLVATSFQRLMAADLGFSTERVLVANVMLPPGRYNAERAVTFVREAEQRLRALRNVRAVGATNIVPFLGANTAMDLAAEERARESRAQYRSASWRTVSPGYFDAMRIPLKRGRAFGPEDGYREGMNAETDRTVVVNDVLAAALWPESDAVGKRITLVSGSTVTVVGMVGSTRHLSPDSLAGPAMYFAHAQFPIRSMWFTVRTDGDPKLLATELRRELAAIDPLLPVSGVQTLDALLDEASAEPRLTMLVFTIFGTAALLLVSVGLYGMVSYSVSQRTREIGVMIALGASPRRVVSDVLEMGLRLGVIGVVAGGVLSFGLAGALRAILYDTRATDAATYVLVALLLVAVTTMASAIPARRASRLDPVRALRSES